MARHRIKIKYRTYIDQDFGTRAIQNPETGKMEGRKSVRGRGDSTAVIRATSPKESKGWILGRTAPIQVRGTNKHRGYIRQL